MTNSRLGSGGAELAIAAGAVVVLLALSAVVFLRFPHELFWYLDGAATFDLVQSSRLWGSTGGTFGLDPIRAAGSPFFPTAYDLLPTVLGSELVLGRSSRIVIYVLYVGQVAVTLAFAAVVFERSASAWALATWVFALVVLPIVWMSSTTLAFPIAAMTPYYVDLGCALVVMVSLFRLVGRSGPLGNLAASSGLVATVAWLLLALPMLAILVVPGMTAFATALMLHAGTRREIAWKAGALAVLSLGLAASSYGVFVRALASGNAWAFFSDRIATYQHGLEWSSMLWMHERYPVGSALVLAALVAALVRTAAAVVGGRRTGSAALNLGAGFAVAGTLLLYPLLLWTGLFPSVVASVRLFYFEIPLLPFYALIVADAVLALASRAVARSRAPAAIRASVLTAVLCVATALVGLNVSGRAASSNPYRAPPAETPIVEVLRREAALTPGAAFRGRVATIDMRPGAAASWDRMIASDVRRASTVGNDHRFVGLWHYGVPTFQEYSQLLPAAIWLLQTTFFSDGQARQDMRNHVLMHRAPANLARLLGVRWVVSDMPVAEGEARAESGDQTLYELPGANVSGYDVRGVVNAPTASEALSLLARDDVDLRSVAIVHEDVAGPFNAAQAALTLDRGGVLRVRVTADGPGLLVLPFGHSACWTIVAAPPGASLLRVDLALLGLRFPGGGDFTLRLATGLSRQPDCLRRDGEALAALGLAASRPAGR